MTEQNDSPVAILPDITRAAEKVARDWASVITAEDAAQEISVKLLADNYAKTVAEMDPGARFDVLVRIGTHIAAKYRDDYDHFTGNFRYSTLEVRSLLDKGALVEEKVRTDTERMDLEEGMKLLRKRNESYAEYIRQRYGLGEQMTSGAERMTLSRAVDALTDCMNHVYRNRQLEYVDGTGTRKVASREDAYWIHKFQYEGDGRRAGSVGQSVVERAIA